MYRVPTKTFRKLAIGDIFRAPSAFTAPGATLFPHYIGETFIAFTELSCSFLKEVCAGDTLYSELETIKLTPDGENDLVETKVSVHNQNGELVLSGRHKYLLKS